MSIPRLVSWILVLTLSAFAADKRAEKKNDLNQPGPLQLTKDGERWAEKTLKRLSPEEKIGQLIQLRALAEFQNVESPAYTELRDQIKKYHIGSVIMTVRVDGPFLLKNQPYEAAELTNQLQRESDLPLLVAADFERGPSMRLLATPFFPHAMAFGAAGKMEYAEAFGRVVAQESRAMGVHWNFFPVADVNSNPANPIINTRSFGEDPNQVGDLVAAYIRGSRQGGMLTTAKHFPGHGDTATDSHLELAKVGGDLQRLQAVELPPFQKAIDSGVDSIMIAHVTVPALEPDPNKVATISHKVVTDLLIDKMGFKGLIVTDAMEMRALTSIYKNAGQNASQRAAVDAFKAGNDMILLPSDVDGAFNGLLAAVKSGEITPQELDLRVRKVLQAKAMVGLHRGRFVDVNALRDYVAKPEDMALAQQVADAAVTLVRDKGNSLPLLQTERRRRIAAKSGTFAADAPYEKEEEPGEGVLALILTDDMRTDSGRAFERELRARIPDARITYVDPRVASFMAEPVTESVLAAKVVMLVAYVVPTAGKQAVRAQNGSHNSVSLEGGMAGLVQRTLQIAGQKTAMVAMGNPYLAGDFPTVQTYICTFSNSPTSETAAVKALFGEIPIHGKLPVTLPNIAARGTGIERAAWAAK